jgi:glycosyltransferase involved in cell wall biosynthesis
MEISRVKNKYGLMKEYLLFVGSISTRKNTERLVQAFSLSKVSRELNLVFAGTISYQGEKILQDIKKYHLDDRVKMLGYVEDSDLPALYSGARGFVFPTFYEGFGLSILEAMACANPGSVQGIIAIRGIGLLFKSYLSAIICFCYTVFLLLY